MNPFISIWRHPSKTIQHIVDHKSIPFALMIVALSSSASSFMGFSNSGFFEQLSLPLTIFIVLLFSIFIGIAGWGITTVVYTWIGKLLGGTGTIRNMGLAIGAGTIPTIWTAPIGIIAVLLYGKQLFAAPSNPFGITNMSIGFFLFHTVILMGVSIFTIIVQSKGIGIVHHFSAWRGFGTILIVAGIVFVLSFLFIASLLSFFIF